jgi:hypothetical protein
MDSFQRASTHSKLYVLRKRLQRWTQESGDGPHSMLSGGLSSVPPLRTVSGVARLNTAYGPLFGWLRQLD